MAGMSSRSPQSSTLFQAALDSFPGCFLEDVAVDPQFLTASTFFCGGALLGPPSRKVSRRRHLFGKTRPCRKTLKAAELFWRRFRVSPAEANIYACAAALLPIRTHMTLILGFPHLRKGVAV